MALNSRRSEADTHTVKVSFRAASIRLIVGIALVAGLFVVSPSQVAQAAEPTWWNAGYSGRQAVTIQTKDAIGAGYSVSVTFDHQAMVAQGQSRSDGEDIRIVRWNGTGWDGEQDRVVAVGSSWNTTTTTLYFKTSSALGSGAFDRSYYLYFGNATPAASLHNADNVYLLYDDFNDNVINTSKWTTFGPAGSVVEQNGRMELRAATSADTSYGFFATTGSIHGYFSESTFSIVNQLAASSNLWSGAAGLVERDGLTHRANNIVYRDLSYNTTVLGPSTLTGNTFAGQRLGAAIASDDSAYYWENGVLKGHATTLSGISTPLYFYRPQAATNVGDFLVTFDDIVIRKYVNNEPATVLDGNAVTKLTVVVDPILTFTVHGRTVPGDCNGATMTRPATSTAVDLGSINTVAASSAQDIQVATNAANGYTVYLRRTQPLQSSADTFADVTGTEATPVAFPATTEAFGYSTDGVATFATNKWAGITDTNQQVASVVSGPTDTTSCVAYQVRADSTTIAGNYTSTVLYTAVPSF